MSRQARHDKPFTIACIVILTGVTKSHKNIMKHIKYFLLLLTLLAVFGTEISAKKSTQKQLEKTTISEQDQQKFDYYFYEAVSQRQQGNYDQAIDLLTECYYVNPQSAAVSYEFAMIYTAMRDFNHAMQFMSRASRLDPSNSWYKMGFAELCIKANDYKKAIAVYEDITKNHPEQEEVIYMLASLYKQTGDLKKSIQYLDKLEEKIGVIEDISTEKYGLYKILGKDKKANAEIDKLIAKHPYEVKYKILKAGIYMQDQKPDKAKEMLVNLHNEEPDNGMVISTLYEFYLTTGDSIAAKQLFGETMSSPTVAMDDKIGLLTQFISKENQKVADAEVYITTLINQYPDNELLRSYYSSFLLMQKRDTEAISELKQLLKINPKSKEGWTDLIKVYTDRDSIDQMLVTTDEAIKNIPDENLFYFYKGLALTQKKDYKQAMQTYRAGLNLTDEGDSDMVAQFTLRIADLHAETKQMDSAFVYYEKAYQLAPNDILLLNNYAYYLSLAGKDLDKAESMSAKTVRLRPDESTFLDTYAWIYFKQKNYVLAKMYIMQALDKDTSNNPTLLEHCGDILFFNNEIDEAVTYWEKAKEAGEKSPVLEKKIRERKYFEE